MEKQGKIFGKDFNLFDVLNEKDRLLFLESKDKTFKEMQEFQNEILVKMKKSFRQKKMTILSASILFGGLLFVAGASLFQHLKDTNKK